MDTTFIGGDTAERGMVGEDLGSLCASEWLVANGLGGYAASTIPGLNTRKYHGLLVAAMTPAVRRMVILSRVEETVVFGGRRFELACNEYPQAIHPQGHRYLKAFSHEPFPRWAYQGGPDVASKHGGREGGWTVEKQLRLVPGRNAALLSYTVWGGSEAGLLELRPLLALRPIHELMYQWNGPLRVEKTGEMGQYHVPATSRTPEVFLAHGGQWEQGEAGGASWYLNTIYRREQQRGYAGLEDLWCPGIVHLRLVPGVAKHFVCSIDPLSVQDAVAECEKSQLNVKKTTSVPAAREHTVSGAGFSAATPQKAKSAAIDAEIATLHKSAERFAVAPAFPAGKVPLLGDYHWYPPSPRNALIGFTGLYLVSGRHEQARALLLALAGLLRNGQLPAMLAEDASEPGGAVYRATDVSLWFINAVWNYLRYSKDQSTVQHALLSPVLSVIEHYCQGSAPGVSVGEDGLLYSRMAASATTWMDAKLGDWVITPRAGAAVEINALWYNALRIVSALMELPGIAKPPEALSALAGKCFEAFNRRFWNTEWGCCFDVVDEKGVDRSIRPNQLLAISLPFPVLRADRHADVVDRAKETLLTPLGLRTLSNRDPGYQGRYQGTLVSRDRALHNGSVFPWLLGPYVSALVRVRGRQAGVLDEARSIMRPCLERIGAAGHGQLCELFDGEAPHAPGGAVAASTGIAELLRCYHEDILDASPPLAGLTSGNPLAQFEKTA